MTGRGAELLVPRPELFIPLPPPPAPRNMLLLVYTVTPDTETGRRASIKHTSCPLIDHTLSLVVSLHVI